MNLINHIQEDTTKSKSELRKYGMIMFTAFAVITSLLFLRSKAAWMYTAIPSVFFLIFACLLPSALAPIEKFWMKLAAVLGFVMTNVLLTLVFIIAIIPTGLILRVIGKTPLRKGFRKDTSLNTYWLEVDNSGPSSRPDKPY